MNTLMHTPAWVVREGHEVFSRMLKLADRVYREPVVLTDWRGNITAQADQFGVGDTVHVKSPKRYSA